MLWNVYRWCDVKEADFPGVKWSAISNDGTIELTTEQVGKFVQDHPGWYICFNFNQQQIYIDTKLFKQR